MHTNTKNEDRAASFHPAAGALPAPRNGHAKRAPLLRRKCGWCGQIKASSAFRRLKPGEPVPAKPRCRSCERHGSAAARKPVITPSGKSCVRCRQEQDLAHFPKDARSSDRRGGVCQGCRRARAAERDREKATAAGLPARTRAAASEVRISLGIAIAHATCPPGWHRTRHELATYCGCSETKIRTIEERALRKVKPWLAELLRKAGMTVREVQL